MPIERPPLTHSNPSASPSAASTEIPLAQLNEQLAGYPSNHTYRIEDHTLRPSRELTARSDALRKFYPEQVSSFLDVGSCKGYFVFQHALRPECKRAVGIDVNERFVDMANNVARQIDRSDVRFERMNLEEAAADPAAIGGPFRLVQLISTYHYIYWGSSDYQNDHFTHEAALSHLAALCSGAVLFAGPLSIDEAPSQIREAAAKHPDHDYTPEGFITAASRWFDVYRLGYLHPLRRRRPILLLVCACD